MAGYAYDSRREVEEALRAGEKALSSLLEAQSCLKSASNWGMFDILGGGLITTMIKHSRLDDARSQLRRAAQDLSVFAREVRDVRGFLLPQVEIDGWLSFADFFLDNAIADIFVQKKIMDARDEVEEAVGQVECALRDLRALL
ncbi:hypothetical protein [Olsenella urininfantis]|uniref:hypothetical protein n=1 Tax=Olsenella urininfantis TaxID=1871033 RepID=UPI00098458E1|nr:hypothetical protein [Olsenella urininfantis]